MTRHIKISLIILLSLIWLSPISGRELYEYLWTSVLEKHTRQGVIDQVQLRIVDYREIEESQNFRTILRGLTKFDPANLTSKEDKLAFWINVYNIAAVSLILEYYPVKGIKEIGTLLKPVWHKPAITVFDQVYTLSEIEHEILRPLDEPRIHFAIVCASVSCPDLRDEAYSSEKIYDQLEEQTRSFIRNKTKGASFNKTLKLIKISKIFKWFKPDFEAHTPTKTFLQKYLKTNITPYKITYRSYNWKLNGK